MKSVLVLLVMLVATPAPAEVPPVCEPVCVMLGTKLVCIDFCSPAP